MILNRQKKLNKFLIKKLFINKFIDLSVKEQFTKSKKLELNFETISKVVSTEFESANGK